VRIGPALAGARTEAGMSLEDVSDRTRIRRTIIGDIERDDYSSCGGDFYARGHIRAIAKAVGTDPVPLIAQYDDDVAAREQADAAAAVTGPDPRDWLEADSGARSLLGQLPPVGGNGDSDGLNGDSGGRADERPHANGRSKAVLHSRFHQGWRPPRRPALAPDTPTQPDLLAGAQTDPTEPAAPKVAATALAAARLRAAGLRAAAAASPAMREAATGARRIGEQSARQGGIWLRQAGTWLGQAGGWLRDAGVAVFERFTRVRTGDELPSRLIGAAAIFLAALIAVLYGIFSGPAHSAPRPSVSRTHATGHPSRTTPAARHPSSKSPGSAPSAAAAVPLQPIRAVAFGPGGIADGDNPQLAGLAIRARPGGGWNTNWYTTAEFGGLQSGTGLLLDLGRPATVTAVTVRLGAAGGALVQLRAGNAAVPAGLRAVAQGRSAGGDLTLGLTRPVQARYVLIWFTRLPRDSSGTYQATIYHVSVTGRSAGA
jgi:transcriptional regulator with XRE-family HTH domain